MAGPVAKHFARLAVGLALLGVVGVVGLALFGALTTREGREAVLGILVILVLAYGAGWMVLKRWRHW